LSSLNSLLDLAGTGAPGPSPTFDRAHLLFAFLAIGESVSIGRQALAKETGLGEGAVRTVLKKLREEGYAESDPSGCHLTPAGGKLYTSILGTLSPFAEVPTSRLTLGDSQAAVTVRDRGNKVGGGIEQRDAAIRVGASGATTYIIRSSKFTVPGGSADCEKDYPGRVWALLREKLAPRNGDVVILCGAGDRTTARLGALAAAVSLW
jgi:Domain of unknown function (DUF4443)